MRISISLGLATVALSGFLGVSAAAADLGAGAWADTEYARVRMIPGPERGDGSRHIGVHIELAPGWHTYWRHPGASGIPPRFDWSASENLAGTEVRWPAPRRLRDEYGVSFGYLDEVIYPVTLRPEAPGERMRLRLALDYAVCAEICIPEYSEIELTLEPGVPPRPVFARMLAGFEASVPVPTGDAKAPRVSSASVGPGDDTPILTVNAIFADTGEGAELFVEGPEQFYFVAPDGPEMTGPQTGRFDVVVTGAKRPEDLAGARLGATLVTGAGAVETWWTVE